MALESLSPEWWLQRLHKQLAARRPLVQAADRWYDGQHPAPLHYEKAEGLLGKLIDATGTNFLALLVDAAVERMQVEGFRVGGKISDEPWEIWQGNNFDAGSEMVLLEAAALGESYALVDPAKNAAGHPTLTPEHPEQCIVEHQPGSLSVRAAGLKVWHDDLQGLLMATVYLPGRVDTYAAEQRNPRIARAPKWEHQESQSGPHGLGEVPLVPFTNRPRMLKPGSPEFTRAVPNQRRINKTILDRLVNQEYGAFKQKWATGMDIPEDENGNPVEPFQSAVDRLVTSDDPATRFGQFEPEDIEQLLKAVEADAKHMAAIVPTPPDYLLGEMVNVSAEGLKAAQASLVSRVRKHMRHREEPLETIARLALKAAGKDVPNVAAMQTIWRNPEFRTEGELVDALVKMRGLRVPYKALWERWGASPQEILDWPGMLLEEENDPVLGRIMRDVATDQGPQQPAPAPPA